MASSPVASSSGGMSTRAPDPGNLPTDHPLQGMGSDGDPDQTPAFNRSYPSVNWSLRRGGSSPPLDQQPTTSAGRSSKAPGGLVDPGHLTPATLGATGLGPPPEARRRYRPGRGRVASPRTTRRGIRSTPGEGRRLKSLGMLKMRDLPVGQIPQARCPICDCDDVRVYVDAAEEAMNGDAIGSSRTVLSPRGTSGAADAGTASGRTGRLIAICPTSTGR